MIWRHFNVAFLAMFGVFAVGIPVGILLHDFVAILKERRQNKRWLKHCKSCLYFRRIQFTTLDSFHKRGVVCDNGIDFEYVTDPLSCERYKKSPSK